ncbi:hypothetical protein SAICODRAFT_19960 [Saitoella complicata NRRL Y-17804]|uniref:uncharacterized protein n=1 Tax=Saitoella complicata (strain BCRC 22490 / CBS 7301 / JCM 7358 / NBRC 10748 / NRRL Y-17804) TaxID=698492 RepID=UPI0008681E3D|nr:uncharacterized protein SAICODRAFT_19960 [Saitoella complicata NRRL Y-17804]ODQ52399.1 hypothetical protein SAICODRAFT_19960 [Saitoella complicata NRRL Y-17804]
MTTGLQDILDAPNYDPCDTLNLIFTSHESLTKLLETHTLVSRYARGLDREIEQRTRGLHDAEANSADRLAAIQDDLGQLIASVNGVREQAAKAEDLVAGMTVDIKRLDGAKRNLTISMTTLKRLQMLTTAYEQLKVLSKARQYTETAHLLSAVLQLMNHFKTFRSIDQIATLSRSISDLQRELLEQVCQDFENAFSGQGSDSVTERMTTLNESCLMVDVFGDDARLRLLTWYCNTQLREYRTIFRRNDEAGSLDNISRRFSWLKRALKQYDEDHAKIFPNAWKVGEVLCRTFCEDTRDDVNTILSQAGKSVNVKLLLTALQETLEFEQFLEKRALATTFEPRSSIDTIASRDERSLVFGHTISGAFQPYLSVYIESKEHSLADMIQVYRNQPIALPDHDDQQAVLQSSADLFTYYRQTLAQCAKLSDGAPLLDLSRLFSKWLRAYGDQVLMQRLSERSESVTRIEDACMILNTADYCHTTVSQLEEKIHSKIQEDLREQVNFESLREAFIGIIGTAIRVLVKKVEAECDMALKEMHRTDWDSLASVGDQSSYVHPLSEVLKSCTKKVFAKVIKERYARTYCDNLVHSFAQKFIDDIVRCRPISEIGAEQLLLDTYAIKNCLLELPTLLSEEGTQTPANYVKFVNKGIAKIETILKVILTSASTPDALAQNYFFLIGDKSIGNFAKILDLKGVRKADQGPLLESKLNKIERKSAQPWQHRPLIQKRGLIKELYRLTKTLTKGDVTCSAFSAEQ